MERHYDYIVIGSGIAGLFFALKVAEKDQKARIAIITKKGETDTSTNRAQGGIAAVLSNTDSFESHIQDSIEAGCGLCHNDVVETVVETGPRVIEELIAYGVKFSQGGTNLDLGREGGHSHKRVAHAEDLTGQEIERALLTACRSMGNRIDFFRDHIVLDLITHKIGGKEIAAGAFVFAENDREFSAFCAPVTMMASGGAGQVYYHNTNPLIATGDGVAMAYRAGVPIGNMEFIQFHPTTLHTPGRWPFLISEAVRGEGGRLKSVDGRFIMDQTHPQGDLAPRDVVARAIDKELKASGEEYVMLDISHKDSEFIKSRFPNIYEECLRRGFDITIRDIPVVPGAHYSCGGIVSDINGTTALPGLYVAGEVAMTGMHGANRLASNSLLEAVVMARLSSEVCFRYRQDIDFPKSVAMDQAFYSSLKYPREKVLIRHDRRQLTRVMSDFVGIVRNEDRLLLALDKIDQIKEGIEEYYLATPATYDVVELRNMATVSKLIVESAISRKESRGLHYMEDYPERDDRFLVDTIINSSSKIKGNSTSGNIA